MKYVCESYSRVGSCVVYISLVYHFSMSDDPLQRAQAAALELLRALPAGITPPVTERLTPAISRVHGPNHWLHCPRHWSDLITYHPTSLYTDSSVATSMLVKQRLAREDRSCDSPC